MERVRTLSMSRHDNVIVTCSKPNDVLDAELWNLPSVYAFVISLNPVCTLNGSIESLEWAFPVQGYGGGRW
jgi:hypothetical protein